MVANFSADSARAAVPIVLRVASFAAERTAAAVPFVRMRHHFFTAAAAEPFVPVVPFRSALAANHGAAEELFYQKEEAIEKGDDYESDD